MYLHLGQETVVRTRDIVGIFDIENTSLARSTRAYLAQAEKQGLVVNVTFDLPKSFVVCHPKKKNRHRNTGAEEPLQAAAAPEEDKTESVLGSKVFLSQISSATLRKRAGYIDDIANV